MDFAGWPLKSMVYVNAAGTDSDRSLEAWVKSAVKFARTQE